MKRTISAWLILSVLTGLLMSSVLQANPIAYPGPSKELKALVLPVTMTGTLAWKTTKQADGKEQKTLQLTTPDKKVIDLVPKESVNPAKYDKFIGETVKVVALTEVGGIKNTIKSIKEIKDAPQPKS